MSEATNAARDTATNAVTPAKIERRRLLDKLVRELVRSEAQAVDHAAREAKKLGDDSPPVLALRDVGEHADAMRDRMWLVLDGHDVVISKNSISATLAALRQRVADRVHDAERAYRGALLDLRHGLDVVRVMRDIARLEELFALIRWCDDWLAARRTLLARVEAQLCWFTQQPLPEPPPQPTEDPAADSI
jgi:hypothetical protein